MSLWFPSPREEQRLFSPTQRQTLQHSVRGLVVMIVACQVIDPGSIPGERTFFSALIPLFLFPLGWASTSLSFCSLPDGGRGENKNKDRLEEKKGERKKNSTWGDARIELATSCTLSKNHTTRPITHFLAKKKNRQQWDLNPRGHSPST